MVLAVIVVAAVAVLAIVVAAVVRHGRGRTPAEEYQRNINGLRLGTYRQVTPHYTRQVGEPNGYVGGTGPPVGI
jgi:hypothetical protein